MKHNLLVDIRRHWKSYLSLFFLFLASLMLSGSSVSLSGIFNDYYQKELVQLVALDYFETSDSWIDQAFLSSHFKSGSYETFDFDTAAAFQNSFSIGGEKELTCDSARIVSLPDEIPDNIQALGSGEEKLFLGSYPKEMEVLLCFYTADVLTKDLGLESREDLLGSRISFESGDSCFSFSGYRISGILSNSSSSYFSYGEHTFFLNCSDPIIIRNTSRFTKERLLFLKSFEDYPEFRSILGDYSVKYGGSYEAYLELTKMQAFVRLIQLCVFLPLGVCLLLLFLLSFRKFLGKEKRSAVIRLVSGYSLKKVSLSLISGILLPLILAFFVPGIGLPDRLALYCPLQGHGRLWIGFFCKACSIRVLPVPRDSAAARNLFDRRALEDQEKVLFEIAR